MKKIPLIIVVAILVISFNACSVKLKITKVPESKSHFADTVYIGQDFFVSDLVTYSEKYRVFHQASSSFSGTNGIRSSAENRAKKFCKDQGKDKSFTG